MSLDFEFLFRSGLLSIVDDERELFVFREKKFFRIVFLKRYLRNRKKSKGKDFFDGLDNMEKRSEKKEKGFFGKIRIVRFKEKIKISNVRVYDELVEKNFDFFDIIYRMVYLEMEEKIFKGNNKYDFCVV